MNICLFWWWKTRRVSLYHEILIHLGDYMKTLQIFLLLFCVSLVGFSKSEAQEAFAGTVKYAFSADDNDMNLTMATNGNKLKVSISLGMGDMDLITDKNGKEQTMIMHGQKMYMTLTASRLEKMKTMMSSMGKGMSSPIVSEPVHTGETKKILNYVCEKLVDKGPDGTTELWVTDKLGFLAFTGSPMVPMPSLQNTDAATYFPLEIRSLDKDGETLMKMTAEEISLKKPAEADFSVPADYTQFSFPGSGN